METPNGVQPNVNAEVQPVAQNPEQVQASPAGGETVESLKAQLEVERGKTELEQAKRIIAESDAQNAKKDIIAIKTGRRREEVDLAKEQAQQPAIQAERQPVQAQDAEKEKLAAELAEQKRITSELLRSQRPGFAAPTGGGGFAESPAPKPQGYWSEEKRAALKKRGWSDEKIDRCGLMAQRQAALSESSPESYGLTAARKY